MAELLLIGIIIVIWAINRISVESKVNNYPSDKINTSKMLSDKMHNNLSDSQVRRNLAAGKYDYKPGEFDIYNRDTWK